MFAHSKWYKKWVQNIYYTGSLKLIKCARTHSHAYTHICAHAHTHTSTRKENNTNTEKGQRHTYIPPSCWFALACCTFGPTWARLLLHWGAPAQKEIRTCARTPEFTHWYVRQMQLYWKVGTCIEQVTGEVGMCIEQVTGDRWSRRVHRTGVCMYWSKHMHKTCDRWQVK